MVYIFCCFLVHDDSLSSARDNTSQAGTPRDHPRTYGTYFPTSPEPFFIIPLLAPQEPTNHFMICTTFGNENTYPIQRRSPTNPATYMTPGVYPASVDLGRSTLERDKNLDSYQSLGFCSPYKLKYDFDYRLGEHRFVRLVWIYV